MMAGLEQPCAASSVAALPLQRWVMTMPDAGVSGSWLAHTTDARVTRLILPGRARSDVQADHDFSVRLRVLHLGRGRLPGHQGWGKRAERAAQACVAAGAKGLRLNAWYPRRPNPCTFPLVNLSVVVRRDRTAALRTMVGQVDLTSLEFLLGANRQGSLTNRLHQVRQDTA
jgi:hypothetical protein